MSRKLLYLAIFGFVLLFGCSKMCTGGREAMSPDEVVQAYLDISLNMNSIDQRKELLKLTTGNLKSAIEQASDDTISKAFIKQNYQLERYSVIERRDRTPRETEITFLLSYKNLGPNKEYTAEDAPQVTTENTLSVVKNEGVWYIRDVLGKKTSIDFALGDEIKPAPGGTPDPATTAAPEEQANAPEEDNPQSP